MLWNFGMASTAWGSRSSSFIKIWNSNIDIDEEKNQQFIEEHLTESSEDFYGIIKKGNIKCEMSTTVSKILTYYLTQSYLLKR